MAYDFNISIRGQLDKTTKINIQKELKALQSQLALNLDIDSKKTLGSVSSDMKKVSTETKKANTNLKDASKTIKDGFVYEMGVAIQRTIEWTIAVGGLYAAINKVKDSIQFIKDMDEQLTTIAMVTGQTRTEVQGLATDYTNLGKALSTNTLELSKSAVALYRQGLNASQVEERLTEITKAAKVAGIGVEEATTYVTVGINAMKVSAEEFNDVLVNVASKAATDYNSLAVAIQKSASSFNNANVSLEKSISYIATVQEVTQESAESIGTSFKTILARFNKVTEAGEDNAEVLNDIGEALHYVGIASLDSDGQLRDTAVLLDELSVIWDGLERNTKAYLATQIAGTRQQNRFLTLMDNYTRSLELYDEALNSAGATAEQYAKYQESLAAAQERLNVAWEEFFQKFIQNGDIQNFYDLMLKMVESLSLFSDNVDLLSAGLTAFGIIMTGTIIKSIIGYTNAIIAAEGATLTLSAAMSGLPFVAIATVIGLLVGEIIKANDKFEEHAENVRDANEALEKFNGLIDGIEVEEGVSKVEQMKNAIDDLRIAIEKLNAQEKIIELEEKMPKLIERAETASGRMKYKAQVDLSTAQNELEYYKNLIKSYENATIALDDYLSSEEELMGRKTRQFGEHTKIPDDKTITPLGTGTEEEVKTLSEFYDIISKIAESEYLMDMAEGTDEYSEKIKNHIPLLKEYQRQLNNKIIDLEKDIDMTDGVTSAEVELIEQRDDLLATYRDLDIEIKDLTESYRESTDTFEENRESVISSLEEQKSLLEQQLSNLEAKEEALDKERKNQEYLLDIQEKLLAVEKARETLANVQEERNTRMLTTKGFEWIANPQDVAEAQSNVADAEGNLAKSRKDYREWLEDERLESEKEALQSEIDMIEKSISNIESIEADSYDTRMDLLNSFITRYNLAIASSGISSMSGIATNGTSIQTPQMAVQTNAITPPTIASNTTETDNSQASTITIAKLVVQAPEMATFEKIIETAELKVKTM